MPDLIAPWEEAFNSFNSLEVLYADLWPLHLSSSSPEWIYYLNAAIQQ